MKNESLCRNNFSIFNNNTYGNGYYMETTTKDKKL